MFSSATTVLIDPQKDERTTRVPLVEYLGSDRGIDIVKLFPDAEGKPRQIVKDGPPVQVSPAELRSIVGIGEVRILANDPTPTAVAVTEPTVLSPTWVSPAASQTSESDNEETQA